MSDVLLFDLSQQLEKLFAEKRYDDGFALGRHILQSYPRHLQTYKQMGLAALDAGRLEDSADLLQRALSADPEDGKLWETLHDVAMQLALPDQARLAADYARDLLHPQDSDSTIAQGHVAARARAWTRAYEHYRQGYLAQPQRMDAALGMAASLFNLRQHHAARAVAQHILAELPYSLHALWISISIALELNDKEAPLDRYLRTARSLDPDYACITRWLEEVAPQDIPQPQALLPAWESAESSSD